MAAKNIDPLGNGVDAKSIESGPEDWARTCGVCHVGGGQMEYDRDQNAYSASSASGDYYTYQRAYWNGSSAVAGSVRPTIMSATNKAEVDCLMCHLDGANNGVAWLRTMGCGSFGGPIGPSNDPNCTGTSMYPGVPTVPATWTAGQFYDMYNRNAAIKDGKLNFAAAMGLGATGVMNAQGSFTGITGQPSSIPGSMISYTPKSKNCSVCHARDDSTIGLPGMMAMKYGYGNFNTITPPGAGLDTDLGTLGPNTKLWFELGCKTGMGKRAHRIGAGPNDKYGMSMFLPSTLDMSPATVPNAGDPIANKMPDQDPHDMAGMQCATCHYTLGSSLLTSGTLTVPAAEHHGLAFPEQVVYGIDHMFAQADSSPDTKSRNNLDGTISCESCHLTKTHPRFYNPDGTLRSGITTTAPPIPVHSGIPALHIQKIGCSTCHIPEVYAAPGRLKYRDWTVGEYKGGFRNMLDWNYDLVTGSHKTVPVLHQWMTKYGETKIYPILTSVMPNWVKNSVNSLSTTGTETTFTNPPTATPLTAPVFHRDSTAAARTVKAAHPEFDIRINGGNIVPLFDGFSLSDSFEIDTKDEIDAMLGVAGFAGKMRLYNTAFDVTHGVAPKEWALGSVNQGGCIGCHSSRNPMSPNYSPKSVAFFESYQQPLQNAGQGIGKYDLIKNWFALFADYDCTGMVNGLCAPGYCMPMCQYLMGMDVTTCTGFCSQAATACVGGTGPGGSFTDSDLFNPMNGAPAMTNPFLAACVGQMAQGFDAMMGFPAGTAMQMGMYDGIAGLQGFTIAETVTGSTMGCQPFAGPVNFSPVPGQNVNNCMPNAAMFNGTCTGPTVVVQGMTVPTCVGGFRAGGPCAAVVDCQGALAPTATPLLYSRADARSHFKINFQQTSGGAVGTPVTAANAKVTWPISVEKNPSNAAHVTSWDQALKCVDGLGFPAACTDGAAIQTTVNGNDLLGYSASYLNYLESFMLMSVVDIEPNKPLARIAFNVNGLSVNVNGGDSLRANSYSWNFGDGATATTPMASHTYATTGVYTLTLTVTNATSGISDTKAVSVAVTAVAVAPTMTFTLDVALDSSLTVTITDTASDLLDGNNLARFTNWGDGLTTTTAAGTNNVFTHTYANPGKYNITHSVMNRSGLSTAVGLANNYVPTRYSISGTVSDNSVGLGGAVVTATMGTETVSALTTATSGTYSINLLTAGSYTVATAKSGKSFTAVQVVTVGPNATGVNFAATHSIYGSIDGASLPSGIIMSVTNPSTAAFIAGTTTSTNSFTLFSNLLTSGTYSVNIVTAPAGGTIAPASQLVTVTDTDKGGVVFNWTLTP